LVIDYN